jgi:hypothetical protein
MDENDGAYGQDLMTDDLRWAGHECDWQGDMDGSTFCCAPGHPCENAWDMGPAHDPYGVSCDLTDNKHRTFMDGTPRPPGSWVHRGVNPLPGPGPEPQYIEWEGGGYCAGDPLPVRNRRYLAHDGTEMPR